MKIRGILIVGVIMAVVLLVGTGFSGTVYAKKTEKFDTIEKVQSKINSDFMKWYERNTNRLPSLSKENIRDIFIQFLKENPQEVNYLRALTYLEEKTHKGVKVEQYNAVVILSSQDYEKIKVTITYYQVHILWWTVTYGENDKINAYMHGKVAQEFYDQWENSVTWGELLMH